MWSRPSPKGRSTLVSPPNRGPNLAALPTGRAVAIDANIFIYHFTQSPLTAAYTGFLQRVKAVSGTAPQA